MRVEPYHLLCEALVVRAMELHLEFSYPRETKGQLTCPLALGESGSLFSGVFIFKWSCKFEIEKSPLGHLSCPAKG